MKVLIVEDEPEIRELLEVEFKESKCETRALPDANNILNAMEAFLPDVIVIDQMMPGKSGKEAIVEIRSHGNFSETPIMMVTGLDAEPEKIAALELGADDYITKPFGVREVIVRAQALHRRSTMAHKGLQKKIETKDLVIDLAAHRVMLRGQEVSLTLTEFKILRELLRQSGQVLSRDLLRERALGNLNVTDRTIDVHMAALRKKLDTYGDQIETVRGVGYRLAL